MLNRVRQLAASVLGLSCAALACTPQVFGTDTVIPKGHYPKGSTAFCLQAAGGPVSGISYGANEGLGMLVVNRRGSAKKGFSVDAPAEWTSRHGSVTFTQYSRDFAWGGMNEAGLVVEMLGIPRKEAMQFPDADARPAVRQAQWVQYQLDTAATVEEVVASDGRIRISGKPSPKLTSHYLVSDAKGDCAVVEFLGGKLTAWRGTNLAARALSDTMYTELAAALQEHDRAPGPLPAFRDMPESAYEEQSSARFLHAATMTRAYSEKADGPAMDYARKILDAVRCTGTQWSIVYDIPGKRVSWTTASAPGGKTLDLASLEFSPDAPVLCMDMRSSATGDVRGSLAPWTHDINSALIREATAAVEAGAGDLIGSRLQRKLVESAMEDAIRATIEHVKATCPPQEATAPAGTGDK